VVQDAGFVLAAVLFAKVGGRTVSAWQFGLQRPGTGWLGPSVGWLWAVGMMLLTLVVFLIFSAVWAEIVHSPKEKLLEQLGANEGTTLLLASALLFVRSLLSLQTESLGMNTENIVTAQITLGQSKYPGPPQRLAFYEELERKLKDLPGISGVALSDSLPPSTTARTVPFVAVEAQGRPPLPPDQGIGGVVGWRSVTPDYFSVLNIPVLRGRSFDEADRMPGASAVILNQELAQRLFPGEDPLGRIVRLPQGEGISEAAFTVIGVAGNAHCTERLIRI